MNERFFELALKAMDFQGAVDTDTELKLTNDELAKFAELIVRECSQFVEDKFDFCGDEIIIAEKILEHFGVTE